jgi:hypothetical protein
MVRSFRLTRRPSVASHVIYKKQTDDEQDCTFAIENLMIQVKLHCQSGENSRTSLRLPTK